MPADSRSFKLPDTGLKLTDRDRAGALQGFGAYDGGGLCSNCIGHNASADLKNVYRRMPGNEPPMIDALLSVDKGKIGVRTEAKQR